MRIEGIEVKKPGLSTSIQDRGRIGYQQFGMVVAGAMDPFALEVGNILVGNKRDTAGIEIALMGPRLKFLQDTVIAICGANLSPMIDGNSIGTWKSYRISKGQTLTFGKPLDGTYAYLTVSGGIDTPEVMGSRSTYVKGGIGGLNGGYLKKGDMLPVGEPAFETAGRSLPPSLIPNYNKPRPVRMIPGPDDNAFTQAGLNRFLTSTYQVTTQTDRMGARLKGSPIEHVKGADIISDAIFPGTIQVPANGQPIILLADRQPTGGYTRIGTVITEDIARVAQKQPGEELTFEVVSLTLAQGLYQRRANLLKVLNKVV